jgi:hypothetical protein
VAAKPVSKIEVRAYRFDDDAKAYGLSRTTLAEGGGALSIAKFCAYASVGRTTAFGEIKAGRLVAHKRGRSTIILIEDADAWLKSLPLARPSASDEVVAHSKTLKKETRR